MHSNYAGYYELPEAIARELVNFRVCREGIYYRSVAL